MFLAQWPNIERLAPTNDVRNIFFLAIFRSSMMNKYMMMKGWKWPLPNQLYVFFSFRAWHGAFFSVVWLEVFLFVDFYRPKNASSLLNDD